MKLIALTTVALALLSGAVFAAPGHTAMAKKTALIRPVVSTKVASASSFRMDKSMPMPSGSSMSMAAMTANLQGKTGDSFDKAFLSEMMMHHQGAISMAKLALTHSKHQQVKDLAKSIISAQMKEIAQMQKWQKSWGYAKP